MTTGIILGTIQLHDGKADVVVHTIAEVRSDCGLGIAIFSRLVVGCDRVNMPLLLAYELPSKGNSDAHYALGMVNGAVQLACGRVPERHVTPQQATPFRKRGGGFLKEHGITGWPHARDALAVALTIICSDLGLPWGEGLRLRLLSDPDPGA